jgi:hypothetical protein
VLAAQTHIGGLQPLGHLGKATVGSVDALLLRQGRERGERQQQRSVLAEHGGLVGIAAGPIKHRVTSLMAR